MKHAVEVFRKLLEGRSRNQSLLVDISRRNTESLQGVVQVCECCLRDGQWRDGANRVDRNARWAGTGETVGELGDLLTRIDQSRVHIRNTNLEDEHVNR